MILDPRPGLLRRVATLVWLPVILGAAVFGPPRLGLTVLTVVAMVLATAGWLVMGLRPIRPVWLTPAALVAVSAAGCVLVAETWEWSIPIAFCFIAVGAAGARLPAPGAVAVFVGTGAGLVVAMPQAGAPSLVIMLLALVSVLLLGMSRRVAMRLAEEQEVALATATRADEEHTRAAALAERARIARDVHDVLAHSLSALAVQLQGARLMLQRDGAAPDTIAQVERAQRLATEGLAEARRAITALRSEPLDLADGLRALVADHPGADLDLDEAAAAALHDPRARETILRTAQEALSNARKHAPDAPVRVRLTRDDDGTELEVRDRPGVAPPPADEGGYGLVGMAERAALIGAQVEAGPTEDGWRVTLRVPRTPQP